MFFKPKKFSVYFVTSLTLLAAAGAVADDSDLAQIRKDARAERGAHRQEARDEIRGIRQERRAEIRAERDERQDLNRESRAEEKAKIKAACDMKLIDAKLEYDNSESHIRAEARMNRMVTDFQANQNRLHEKITGLSDRSKALIQDIRDARVAQVAGTLKPGVAKAIITAKTDELVAAARDSDGIEVQADSKGIRALGEVTKEFFAAPAGVGKQESVFLAADREGVLRVVVCTRDAEISNIKANQAFCTSEAALEIQHLMQDRASLHFPDETFLNLNDIAFKEEKAILKGEAKLDRDTEVELKAARMSRVQIAFAKRAGFVSEADFIRERTPECFEKAQAKNLIADVREAISDAREKAEEKVAGAIESLAISASAE